MNTKDKDLKTLDKIKQFFRFNSKGPIKLKEDFIITSELEKELSPESPVEIRIRAIKELIDTVVNNKLDDSAPAVLWCLLEDLLRPGSAEEHRHLVFAFFRALVQGQYERIGMMRAKLFKLVQDDSSSSDIVPRLELFAALCDNGKDILYFEEGVGRFLLEWMPGVVGAGRHLDFLSILTNCIKYNASYFDEEVVLGLLKETCRLCCSTPEEEVTLRCLELLDAFVCYTNIPSEALPFLVATLCRTVNLEQFCTISWKIMKNLLGTPLGHTTLYNVCQVLREQKEAGMLRGGVFYISMGLWGNKKVLQFQVAPSAVLPSIIAALGCEHTIVVYEVTLGIERLVTKQGPDLLDPTWKLVMDILKIIVTHLEKNGKLANPSMWVGETCKHLHQTINSIEELIESNNYKGPLNHFFEVVERLCDQRPEASVHALITYIAKSITPISRSWLGNLDALLRRFYVENGRVSVKRKILNILATCIQVNRPLFESDLMKIALGHLSNLPAEVDPSIRAAGSQILVDLLVHSEPNNALQVIHLLEKILNRAFINGTEVTSEAEAEDMKNAALGLTQTFEKGIFYDPPTLAVRAFKIMIRHLEDHYETPQYLSSVPTIRSILLECLLRLRADRKFRFGLYDKFTQESQKFSMFLQIENVYTMEFSDRNLIVKMSFLPATQVIVKALRKDNDWKVVLLLLQQLPLMLKNRILFVQNDEEKISDVDVIADTIHSMLSLQSAPKLVNTPPKFNLLDFHSYLVPVLASLVPYHMYLESSLQQKIIKSIEYGMGVRSARQCLSTLTYCVLEMQDTMVKLLPEVLLTLSKISATLHFAIPLLEFLSTLTQVPKIYINFVGDQFMAILAIALPYTNTFKYSHYVVSLSYHVLSSWFIKCRVPYRKEFVKFISTSLHQNLTNHLDDQPSSARSADLVNEDSSNRKRSSSLTEQGSRRQESRSSVSSRLDLRPPSNEEPSLTFHKELTETIADLMATYAYTTSSTLPKRYLRSPLERILASGQSMTWLVGNKLVTVTTSKCHLKALTNGFCNQCWTECKVLGDPLQDPTDLNVDDKTEEKPNESTEKAVETEKTTDDMSEEKLISGDSACTETEKGSHEYIDMNGKIFTPFMGDTKPDRCACICWCKGWAEICVKRPTGSMSWTLRLQNELYDFPTNEPSETFTDPSACFLPVPSYGVYQGQSDQLKKVFCERTSSEPVSIPSTPVKKKVETSYYDYDDFAFGLNLERKYRDDDDSTRARNPVRRSNSSPEMSSNWKNPLLASASMESVDLSGDSVDTKKKQNYSKEMSRGNCEAIPEEMGTTPPSSGESGGSSGKEKEVEMSKPVAASASKPHPPPPPLGISKEAESSMDPSALPPLSYKRDRGHTISVMSPARKPGGSWSDARGLRSPKKKEAVPSKSGISPSYVFLQLYHNSCMSTPNVIERPVLITQSPSVQLAVKNLDWIPPYEVHKIGVLYVGPGQGSCESEILLNEYGSPRYCEFLRRLGKLIDLTAADRQQVFLGGLETNGRDGKYTYVWTEDVMQVVFHVASLMPNDPKDPKGNKKKTHIGNDFVTIVYNNSGAEYDFQTLKAQFNYAVVVVEPLELGVNQIIVKARDELLQYITHTEYKIVSDDSIGIMARQLAVHTNLAAMIESRNKQEPPYASNWLERLRQIKRIRKKLFNEMSREEMANYARAHRPPPPGRRYHYVDDFSYYT